MLDAVPPDGGRRAMPKFQAETFDLEGTRNFLAEREGLAHLRVRKHGALLIIESGPDDDPVPHARLRRVTKQWWTLEMATHMGRWQPTGLRGERLELLETLVDDFGWTLAPVL